jgi:hypothetical protein
MRSTLGSPLRANPAKAREKIDASGTGALPAAQPAQLLVRRQPLDQHLRRRDERTRQGRTIAWRPVRPPTPRAHQRLDTRQFQRHDDPLVQLGERPEFFPEPGEKIAEADRRQLKNLLSKPNNSPRHPNFAISSILW